MQKKISIFSIICFLVLFINVPPAYFVLKNSVSTLYELLQIMCAFLCTLFFVVYVKKNKSFSPILIAILLFWLIFMIATKINGGNIMAVIKPFITTFSLCSLIEISAKYKHKEIIKAALFYFEILIYINLLTIIVFPDGLYSVVDNLNPHYFLGHRNNAIEYILPALCFTFLNDSISNKNITIRTIGVVIASFVTVILTWSANAILVEIFLIAALFLPTKKIIQKFINCWNFFIAYLIACWGIIILRLQYVFAWLIEGILHKSLDFTYRTYIWDNAIEWIKKSPFIGYGYENSDIKLNKIGHGNSAHNYILDYMYMGGFTLLGTVLAILTMVFKKLSQTKSRESYILTYIICGYFILWFATPIHKDVLCIMFFIFTIAYNIQYLKSGEELNE